MLGLTLRCLSCLVKGRSAASALNDLLASSLGPYLGCGLYPDYMYFPPILTLQMDRLVASPRLVGRGCQRRV